MDIFIVQRTDSQEWGDAASSSQRARAESETTPANEKMLRSYHPALAHFESVSVATEWSGNKIWIVASLPQTTYETHAAGREIHIVPYYLMPEYMHMYVRALHDPIIGCINPRKLLSGQDLEALREMFPRAIGARLLVSGFLIILFKNLRDVRASWEREQGLGIEFGRMRIGYDVVAGYNPTGAEVIESGDAIGNSPGNRSSAAALGLKLVLPGGQRAITVPTHAFVKISTVVRSGLYLHIVNWIACVKDTLWTFNPFSGATSEVATGTAGDSPIGKEVWLVRSNQFVGTITETYDPPISRWTPFPYGFRHDLSLVTGENLPDLTTPPFSPKISGWGSYSDALDGRPIFVTGFNVTTGNIEKNESTRLSTQAQAAVAVGSEYFWEKESCSQTVSILWRTRYDGDRAVGDFSGSVLCEGRPTDRVCRAVVFQNYEVPLRDKEHSVSVPTMKGGFVLPSVVRESEIICDAQGR
ncbi:hypothetical protein FQN50_000941 [Emmonsiellopsis sp. PD_5]|nr:hypothetical protein FQN50_000941 [Emmonsiellopsis sp. PD_5]